MNPDWHGLQRGRVGMRMNRLVEGWLCVWVRGRINPL